MDESSTHDNFCVLELFGLFGLSVGYSSHVKDDHNRFASWVASSSIEGSPIVILFDPILQQIRNHIFEKVWSVLSVDVGHIRKYPIEVRSSFLFKVFIVEKVRFPSSLVLLKKRNKREVSLVWIDGAECSQEVLDFLVIGIFDGKEEHQFELEVVFH
jgi:hypothetical protein